MEQNNRDRITSQFAENLVAQMLQRSGSAFSHATPSNDEGIDFLVTNGSHTLALEVKYLAQANKAIETWTDWSRHLNNKANNGFSATPPRHLVLVTGSGENVFTDPKIASMLATDLRTKLSVIG